MSAVTPWVLCQWWERTTLDVLERNHDFGESVKQHCPLVVGRPKTVEEFFRNGEKGDMLNVRIMLWMIGDDCVVWSVSIRLWLIDPLNEQTNDGGYHGSRGAPVSFLFFFSSIKTFSFYSRHTTSHNSSHRSSSRQSYQWLGPTTRSLLPLYDQHRVPRLLKNEQSIMEGSVGVLTS